MGEVIRLRKDVAVPVWGPIVRVTAVMFVLIKAAAFVYIFFFNTLAVPQLSVILQALHLDGVLAVETSLLQATLAPLDFATLAALSPLVGWWIYSRIDTGGQAAVMWGAAVLQVLVSMAVALTFAGIAIVNSVQVIVLLLLAAISAVFTVFFMGLGFIPAQIFKVKL